MMLPHILSVFAAVSKFHEMNMYVLYTILLFKYGKDRCVNPYVVLNLEMKVLHVML